MGKTEKNANWEKHHGQEQKRKFYRIAYPITDRPTLILKETDKYEIIDICEAGIKFFYQKGQTFLPFQTIKGKIKFHDDEIEEIEGKVLRVGEEIVIIQLTKKLSYKRIVKEQLYFRKNVDYP
ncbi:MAG: PilZ domain-containing protein [Phycisphaerae bacterium]